jgi:hypothetical protein
MYFSSSTTTFFGYPLLNIAVVWEVAPCSLVNIDRRFRGFSFITLMEEVSSSEYLSDYKVQRPRRQPSLHSLAIPSVCTGA